MTINLVLDMFLTNSTIMVTTHFSKAYFFQFICHSCHTLLKLQHKSCSLKLDYVHTLTAKTVNNYVNKIRVLTCPTFQRSKSERLSLVLIKTNGFGAALCTACPVMSRQLQYHNPNTDILPGS